MPVTGYCANQPGLRLKVASCLYLSSDEITSMNHHAWLEILFNWHRWLGLGTQSKA